MQITLNIFLFLKIDIYCSFKIHACRIFELQYTIVGNIQDLEKLLRGGVNQ